VLLWLCHAVFFLVLTSPLLICLQADQPDMHHLGALTGLTSLAYRNDDYVGANTVRAIAQLTRLRSLTLWRLRAFGDVQMAQLSTLSRLTFLSIDAYGGDSAATDIHTAPCPHCYPHPVGAGIILRLLLCLCAATRRTTTIAEQPGRP
jgi:hypothetical protein